MLFNALSTLALLPLATAHFQLTWPTNRGFDDGSTTQFPCGGFDSVKTPRTDFPISGGPIQINMEHSQTNFEVYLALGDTPGAYSIVLRPQLAVTGLGGFCMGMVSIPADLNITSGTAATIQVVSDGDPTGGLYQCADVTLVDTALSQSDYNSHCTNGTNVKVTQENISGNPNGTSSDTPSSTSPAASGTAQTAAASPTGAAAHATAMSWTFGALSVLGFALL